MNVVQDLKLGYQWVKQSYDLFLHHPGKWLFLSLQYLLVFVLMPMMLLGAIGALVNQDTAFIWIALISLVGLAVSFSWPVFTSLVIGVCRETHMQRDTPVSEVFSKIRPHLSQLIVLGVLFFVYRILMLALLQSDMTALEQWRQDNPNATDFPLVFWGLMIKLIVLEIPLILATWYSPLLISFQQMRVLNAVQHSIWAALKNLVALISAWLTLTFFVILLMAILGLLVGVIALLSPMLGQVLGELLLLLAFLVATAFLFSIQYFSYLYMYYQRDGETQK